MEHSFAAEGSASEHVPAEDPLKLYVRQIGDGRLLTPAEERELARRKDEGDEAAKKRLIECNLRLVMSITRNYTKASVPLLDLLLGRLELRMQRRDLLAFRLELGQRSCHPCTYRQDRDGA